MADRSRWVEITSCDPGHSQWYIERFRSMNAAGDDLARWQRHDLRRADHQACCPPWDRRRRGPRSWGACCDPSEYRCSSPNDVGGTAATRPTGGSTIAG